MTYLPSTERRLGLRAMCEMVRDIQSNRERLNFRWEPFSEAFVECIRDAQVFVDCGAEFGFYIRLALKYGRPDLRIIAFEPERVRFELLAEAFGDDPRVQLHQVAVSDASTSRMTAKPEHGASLTFAGATPARGDGAGHLAVDTVVLDEVLRDVNVDVLKMDIEGAEVLAFRGMRRLLARGLTTLFVEFHDEYIDAIEPGGLTALRRLLAEHGYRAFDGDGRDAPDGGRVMLQPSSKQQDHWPARPFAAFDRRVPATTIVNHLYWLGTERDTRYTPAIREALESLLRRTDLSVSETYRMASLCKRFDDSALATAWFHRIDDATAGDMFVGAKHFHLGEMRLAEGCDGDARMHFDKCLARIPDHGKAAAYIGALERQAVVG